MRRAAAAAVVTAVVAAAAVGVVVSLPGTGGVVSGGSSSPVPGSPPSWSPAPGTWLRGAWQPALGQPAADAGPAAAPYVVLNVPGRGIDQVWNPYAGRAVATVQPPAGQELAGVAAAGDDRTFILEGLEGVKRVGPMVDGPFTAIAFDELRLRPDGRTAWLRTLFTIKTNTPPFFAVSQDASMLAYTTDLGFETVSLAAGTGRYWPRVDDGQESYPSLSWAGDRTLAFEWVSDTAPKPQPSFAGVRLLDVTAPGSMLQASRLIIRLSRYCASSGVCRDDPLVTPDGSKVLVTEDLVSPGSSGHPQQENFVGSVTEISTRTGQVLAAVAPPVTAPFPGPLCEPLWTDPSGAQVVSYCEHGETYDNGQVRPVQMFFPDQILNFAGYRGSNAFAW
jgi:hypothetical protein